MRRSRTRGFCVAARRSGFAALAFLGLAALFAAAQAGAYSFAEGEYWEFRWHAHKTSWAQGSGSSTTDQYGRYRVVFGPAVNVDGVAMYELRISGDPGDLRPPWDRMGADGNGVIYGAKNGVVGLKKLFDAAGGAWPGSGFFTSFSSQTLMVANAATLSNEFYQGSALKVEQSYEAHSCKYFPGFGTICGGDEDQNYVRKEYWHPSFGPVGYDHHNVYSYCGGGFCSGGETDIQAGLVRSSYAGDPLTSELEVEPNQYADSMPLPVETGTLIGSANDVDASDDISIAGITDRLPIHDWYRFHLDSRTLVDLKLEWTADATDLDLVVTDDPLTESPAHSLGDNVATGQKWERIYQELPPGDYLIGVSAWNTPGSVEYTLTHNLSPTRVHLVAVPREVEPGQSSTVSWTSVNAISCSRPVGGGIAQTIPTEGSMTVTPTATTTYEVTCYGTGSDRGTVTVAVVKEICGNGVREGSETCDDGNTNAGDGCNASCQAELSQAGFDLRGGYAAYLADPANADLLAAGVCDAASAFGHWRDFGNVQSRPFAGGRLRTDKAGAAPDPDYTIDGGFSWDYQGYQGKTNTVVFITKDAPKPQGWDGRYLLLERCQQFDLGGAYIARDYAAINTDVRDAIDGGLIPGFSSVTDHYVKYGFKEGRLTNSGWTQAQRDAWNDAGYLAANPDVNTYFLGAQSEGWKAFGKIGFAHWINFGQYEGRNNGQ